VVLTRTNIILAHFVLAVALAATACGSADQTDDVTLDSTAVADTNTVADTETVADTDTDSEDAADSVDDNAEMAEETSTDGSNSVRVELADGRSWEMDGSCAFNPDASGPAATVLDITGVADDGTEVNILEVWPLDGSTDRGTSFIASLTDAEGVLYVLEAASANDAGGSITLETGLHDNLFYAEGDAPATTGVFTCDV
jgi:hypothetical protein